MTHRIHRNGLILAITILLSLSLADIALATPSFSRQVNADCRACHFQSMHALNKFGRAFKSNAFNINKQMRQELNQRRKSKAVADSVG
ncbi:MAG: hypothetical protein Q9M17_04810 [Mariprofundus sp.]|nr:hypothetical protein [Mariprofundus sp.]